MLWMFKTATIAPTENVIARGCLISQSRLLIQLDQVTLLSSCKKPSSDLNFIPLFASRSQLPNRIWPVDTILSIWLVALSRRITLNHLSGPQAAWFGLALTNFPSTPTFTFAHLFKSPLWLFVFVDLSSSFGCGTFFYACWIQSLALRSCVNWISLSLSRSLSRLWITQSKFLHPKVSEISPLCCRRRHRFASRSTPCFLQQSSRKQKSCIPRSHSYARIPPAFPGEAGISYR